MKKPILRPLSIGFLVIAKHSIKKPLGLMSREAIPKTDLKHIFYSEKFIVKSEK
jgi:hypothetical protein